MKTGQELSKDMISAADLKYIAKPLLFFGLIILGIVIVSIFGMRQFKSLQKHSKEAVASQSTLLKKVDVLTKVEEIIPQGLDFVNIALPNQNAIIYALSQIRVIADKNTLLVSNVRSGGSAESKGVSKISLNFEVTGPQSGIYLFLEELSRSLPVMIVEKVKINTEAGTSKATVTVNVYGADLPKKIPSLTTAVSSLSSDEVELLNELSSYSQPTFSTLDAQTGTVREDPFN